MQQSAIPMLIVPTSLAATYATVTLATLAMAPSVRVSISASVTFKL